MATFVLGAVGAIAGSFIPGAGWVVGMEVGTAVGGVIDAVTAANSIKPTSDFRVSGSSYGVCIPRTWGATRLAGNIIYCSDLTSYQSGGGKGGGKGGPSQTGYKCDVAMIIAKGKQNLQIDRIWCDDKIYYDRATGTGAGTATRIYNLSDTADPLLEAAAIINVTYETINDTTGLPQSVTEPTNGLTPAYSQLCYAVFEQIDLLPFGNRLPNFSFEISETEPVTLGEIVSDLFNAAGLDPEDYDTSAGDGQVIDGYLVASQSTTKDALTQLMTCYPFDLPEIDGKIILVQRGGDPVCSVPITDLGAVVVTPGGAAKPETRMMHTREQDVDLPWRYDLTYSSAAQHFAATTQAATRVTKTTQTNTTLTVALTLTDAAAQAIVERILYDLWLERDTYKFVAGPKYLQLAPSDVVLIPIGSPEIGGEVFYRRARIIEADIALPGELKFTATADDGATQVQIVKPVSNSPVNYTILGPVPTAFRVWSGTDLSAADSTTPGFYVAARAAGNAAGWTGAEVWYSADNVTWVQGGRVAGASVIGAATSALANAAPGWDRTNTVAVQLSDGGVLASTSEAAVLLQQNQVKIGPEYLGFATATADPATPGLYVLSDLYRAELGTKAIGHGPGDDFETLTDALVRISVPAALIGQTVYVKCVGQYETLQSVTDVQGVVIAQNNSAYTSPADIAAAARPYYRAEGYIHGLASNAVALDATYFTGVNLPAGRTLRKWRWNAEPDCSFIYETDSVPWVLHLRIGLKNGSANDVEIPWWVPSIDNGAVILFNGSIVFAANTGGSHPDDSAGTFTIAAGASGTLELFFYNQDSGDPAGNPGHFVAIIPALDQPGITWFDAGA